MKILFLYTKRMLAANKARTAVTFAGKCLVICIADSKVLRIEGPQVYFIFLASL